MITNIVYNKNSLDVFSDMGDESIDCVIADPAFSYDYNSNVVNKKILPYERLFCDVLYQTQRTLKNDRFCIFECNYQYVDFFKIKMEQFFKIKNLVVWVKNGYGQGDLKGSLAPTHSLFLVGAKGKPTINGKRITDVIFENRVPKKDKIHISETNVKVIERLLSVLTKPNDIVFDPYGGSGVTATACKNIGRKFILSEIDTDIYNKIINRIKNENI